VVAEAGARRVVQDVDGRGLQVVVVPDDARAEAVAEEMTVAAVALVEGLCVPPIEALHALGQALEPGLDEEMEVVVEEDPRDAVPGIAANRGARETGPIVAIVIVADDLLPGDTAGRDVVDAVGGERGTREAGHEAKLAAAFGRSSAPG
jgi:hypothetical protein